MSEEQKNAIRIAVRCTYRVWDILEEFDKTNPVCQQLDDVTTILEEILEETT